MSVVMEFTAVSRCATMLMVHIIAFASGAMSLVKIILLAMVGSKIT